MSRPSKYPWSMYAVSGELCVLEVPYLSPVPGETTPVIRLTTSAAQFASRSQLRYKLRQVLVRGVTSPTEATDWRWRVAVQFAPPDPDWDGWHVTFGFRPPSGYEHQIQICPECLARYGPDGAEHGTAHDEMHGAHDPSAEAHDDDPKRRATAGCAAEAGQGLEPILAPPDLTLDALRPPLPEVNARLGG